MLLQTYSLKNKDVTMALTLDVPRCAGMPRH